MNLSELSRRLSQGLLLLVLLHCASSQQDEIRTTQRPSTLSTKIVVVTAKETEKVTQNIVSTSIPTRVSLKSTTVPTMKTRSEGTTPASTSTTTIDPANLPKTKFTPKETAPPSTIITKKTTTPSKVATVDTGGEVSPTPSSGGRAHACLPGLALLLLLTLFCRL